MFNWVLNIPVYISLDNKDNSSQLKAGKYFRKKNFILDFWQGSEYASEVSRLVLMFSWWTLVSTGKCQMEIKIPLGQVFMETYHADKRT